MRTAASEGNALRRVEHHLGTAISLAAHGADDTVTDRFFDRVASYERMFSRFLPESEISRLARGDLALDLAAPEVREVLTLCDQLRARTRGCFDHRRDRGLDPNALAKGWIIQRAALACLRMVGVRSFFVNAGGDVLVGDAPPGRAGWRTGVRHPDDPTAVVAVLDLERTAIATSGTYERGDHIRAAQPAVLVPATSPPISVSVVGPDLGVADALATAVHAGGDGRPAWWDPTQGYELLTVTADGRLRWTPGLDEQIVDVGQSGG